MWGAQCDWLTSCRASSISWDALRRNVVGSPRLDNRSSDNRSAACWPNALISAQRIALDAGNKGAGLITTPTGPVPVEHLRQGDIVTPADGGTDRVIWTGMRAVDCARHPRPETVWPIRIASHAFGPDQPSQPLFLSPNHAIYVDGVLIPVRLLENGGTIVQVKRRIVVYYHFELTRHQVILADGLPAESYLDVGDRADFGDADGMIRLHPEFDANLPWVAILRREAYAAEPFVVTGELLDRARQRLADQARNQEATRRDRRSRPRRRS